MKNGVYSDKLPKFYIKSEYTPIKLLILASERDIIDSRRRDMIERPLYMNKIEPFIDMPVAKILTGIRRSGKSTILEMVKERLLQRGVPEDKIFYARFDSYEFENIDNGSKLYHAIADKVGRDGCYLLLDEVQEIAEWEKAVNSLMTSCGANVFITGSNSKLMSSEIATYLTGRYIVIPVFPLSFAEYMSFRKALGEQKSAADLLKDYMRYGGFPSVASADLSINDAYAVVRDIYASVIYNDIAKRGNIRKLDMFERVVRFMFENVGKTFSAKSVADYMKSEKRSLDSETIYNYIKQLQKAYILYRADRYDVRGKEVLRTREKYYLADPSLKFAVLGYHDTAVASMMENIVYLELLRRGYEVYVGEQKGREIDFVGVRRDEKVYIQVCRHLPDDPKGRDREIGNLLQIADSYPKYVVTSDEFAGGNEDGVKIVYLADFLLQEEY